MCQSLQKESPLQTSNSYPMFGMCPNLSILPNYRAEVLEGTSLRYLFTSVVTGVTSLYTSLLKLQFIYFVFVWLIFTPWILKPT